MTRALLLLFPAVLLLALPAASLAQGQPAPTAQEPEAEADDQAEPAKRPARRARQPRSPWRFGVDGVLAEVGATPQNDSVDGVWSLRASPYVLWQPGWQWEARVGVLADGNGQFGQPSFSRARADVAETYLRWRGGDTRLTAGAQTILWGRVDAVPLIDRVSRVDLTRLLLDSLPERRRSQWALRWEQSWEEIKLDAVWLPAFQSAELPARDSIWNPVNRSAGRVFGVLPTPEISAFVRNASISDQDGGDGGAGLRLTRTGESFDLGLTLSRTRQSLPYYRVDLARAALTGVHPYIRFAALDGEVVWGGATWRTELGYSTNAPLTGLGGRQEKAKLLEWVGAVEFFPGGKGTRVNLQGVFRDARVDVPVLELERYVGVNGEVETTFGQGRWKLGLRFAKGLNVRDTYLGPRLTYTGWEPHEIYVAGHVFGGSARTLGGFYSEQDLVALGWKTRF